jgi:glycosyltransferase involved in cell wall biosynthesis
VYNGDNYLEESIESILAQTYSDFELIIADNDSSDGTAAICEKYATDPRVRYVRNPKNIGGSRNANLTLGLARGKYFRWAAHDDRIGPDLLERCVAVLDRESDVVLVYPATVVIDDDGAETDRWATSVGTECSPSARFAALSRPHMCEQVYGLVRTDVLRRTGGERDYVGSDRVLLCELALAGRFAALDEYLLYKRLHAKNVFTDARARIAWHYPERRGGTSFPHFAQLRGLAQVVIRADVSGRERAKCAASVARWAGDNALRLGKDLAAGVGSLFRIRRDRRPDDVLYNWE